MNDLNQGTDVRSNDALERLLKKASPRPMPSKDDEAAVRHAVKAEWQSITGRHRSRRRVMQYAMAATVLLGVFAAFSVFRTPVVESVQVATIEKSFGAIYLLGESAELRETRDLSSVRSGQTIVTGADAGIALAWGNGGSLRVDENTRIVFTNDASVYLKSGRIYFDSTPSALIAGITGGDIDGFVVRTDHGKVMHVGTQFMTRADSGSLTVSVREGQVAIDGAFHDYDASSGQQVTLSGRQNPSVLSISRYGERWDWVGRTSPPVDMDGRTTRELLEWASREMGLELRLEGEAERRAQKRINGTLDSEPAKALRQWLPGVDLQYHIEEGVIIVSVIP